MDTQRTLRTDAEARALLEESKRTRERLQEARHEVTFYALSLHDCLRELSPMIKASADRIDMGLLLKAIDRAFVADREHECAYEAWSEVVQLSRAAAAAAGAVS